MEKKNKNRTPYYFIFISFALVILTGALLLYMPFSSLENAPRLSVIDALFMSTTSVCVTGLSVVPNLAEQFNLFGKIVIAFLIELGGLSFLTVAAFVIIVVGVKMGVSERYLMKENLNQNSTTGIINLVKAIVIISFSIQLIGAGFNFLILKDVYPLNKAIEISIFHSISSFNNAGIDIFGYNSNMIPFKDNIWLNINTMFLIVSGGIGFIVIYDIIKKWRWKYFSLHTKIVLISTTILIISGTVLFKLAHIKDVTWLQALFQSITARTAGFMTYDISLLNNASYITIVVLMIIGASPCSTGGGLKTTTFFVIIATIFNYARGKDTNISYRRISKQSVIKAFSILALTVIYIMFVGLLISFIEPDLGFKEMMFEIVSAYCTVGLSMGITSSLSWITKLLLCFTMLFGRLGPITLISIWNSNWIRDNNKQIRYVEEKIIIG